MRVGIFGGSFDPVHLGHLILAEQCREQGKLDEVRFIPAARPPHKQHQSLTSFHQRAEMLGLAISGHSAFRIDELEKDRPGPSFTADSLEQLKNAMPDAELCLILGADSVVDLPQWHEPARIAALAELLVVGRPGWALPKEAMLRSLIELPEGTSWRIRGITIPLVEIASREIRRKTSLGESIRYQVPRSVEAYILQHGLYRME